MILYDEDRYFKKIAESKLIKVTSIWQQCSIADLVLQNFQNEGNIA